MAYSVRADPEIDAAFELLGVTPGNRSKIIKQAILGLAELRQREILHQEAEAVQGDFNDMATVRRVVEDMEDLRA